MNPSMEDRAKAALQRALAEWEDIARISREWRSRSLEELLPDLSRDEQLRLQDRIRERDRVLRRRNKEFPPSSPSSSSSSSNSNSNSSSAYEIRRDSAMMHLVLVALHHYNARHPGGEFDPVKPLMQSRVGFRGHIWFHINFWACSRTNSKMIKRFFAEIHHMSHSTYTDKCQDPQKPLALIPVVEICTIIEEPLCKYKSSCGFCPADFEILHPKGCRKFVCGNDKDRIGQRLEKDWPQGCQHPFDLIGPSRKGQRR